MKVTTHPDQKRRMKRYAALLFCLLLTCTYSGAAFAAPDSNPWSADPAHPESDRGNEEAPGGSDWWAEAIGAYTAWEYPQSGGLVGVLDSGIDFSREDLVGKHNWLDTYPENVLSDHGTMVAGIIAAANNDVGLRGIFDTAGIVCAVHTIPATPRSQRISRFDNLEVLDIIRDMIESGVTVINNSWGYDGGGSEEMISYTAEACICMIAEELLEGNDDFVIVQAAGNVFEDARKSGFFCSVDEDMFNRLSEREVTLDDGSVRKLSSLLTYDDIHEHILIVGGVENRHNPDNSSEYIMSEGSCYGRTLDITAPSADLFTTTYPPHATRYPEGYTTVNPAPGAFNMGGTSLAAPMVSGSLGLLQSAFPQLSATQARRILLQTAGTARGTKNSVTDDRGSTYPMLNVGRAMRYADDLINHHGAFGRIVAELNSLYGIMPTGMTSKAPGDTWQFMWEDKKTSGILFADEFDYDGDGQNELLVFYNIPEYNGGYGGSDHLVLEMYEEENGMAALSDTINIRADCLSAAYWNAKLSVFRYEKDGRPAIGLLFFSGADDWIAPVISYQYSEGLFSTIGGSCYGQWPGAYSDDEDDEYGWLSVAFEAKKGPDQYLSSNGGMLDYWRQISNSGIYFAEENAVSAYETHLQYMGLSLRPSGSLDEALHPGNRSLDTGCYSDAWSCLSSLEGDVINLGVITTTIDYSSYPFTQTLTLEDCLGTLNGYR